MDTVQQICALIGTTGFPIVVTVYLLWERTKVIEEFSKGIASLTSAINMLTEYIKGDLKNDH